MKAIGINKDNSILLAKVFALVIFVHGIGYQMQFAIDTYYTFWMGFRRAASDMFYRNGRPVIAAIYGLFSLTGLPNEVFYYVSFIIAIVSLVFSIYLYQAILSKYIESDNLRIVTSFITISNIYIIEYFMFIEKGGFMVGIFFNVMALWFFDKYIEHGNMRQIVYSLVFVALALFTYQGTLALYFILAMPIIYKKADDIKTYIKYFMILVALYWIPMIVELILFKVLFTDTRTGNINLLATIKNAFVTIGQSYTTNYHVVPKWSYLVVFIIVVLINVTAIIKSKKNIVSQIANIIITAIVVSVLPMASIVGAVGWGCPRIVYPIASGVGVFVVNYYVNVKEHSSDCSNAIKILSTIVVISLAAEYISFTNIYLDKYRLNYADHQRCIEIGQAIEEYEAETGNTITQIAFYYDANLQEPYYPGLFNDGDLVMTGFLPWDSQLNMVNYYLGTDYARAQEVGWYKDYFLSRDWNCASEEQLEFDGDTLHYCVY